MSSSLERVSQNPWSPQATEAEARLFCNQYLDDICVYAERHGLHAETLKCMFTTKAPWGPLYELYISADALGDHNMPRILKDYCDILGPVLDDKTCPPFVQRM